MVVLRRRRQQSPATFSRSVFNVVCRRRRCRCRLKFVELQVLEGEAAGGVSLRAFSLLQKLKVHLYVQV